MKYILIAALILGIDKVLNEHKMTKAYERQAVALERLAAATEALAILQAAK